MGEDGGGRPEGEGLRLDNWRELVGTPTATGQMRS